MQRSDWVQTRSATYLVLLGPIRNIVYLAATTDVDVFAGPDEHVIGGDDVDDRWLARVVPSYPERDRDVVRGATVGYGQQAVETEQQLGAAVVVRCNGGMSGRHGAQRGGTEL